MFDTNNKTKQENSWNHFTNNYHSSNVKYKQSLALNLCNKTMNCINNNNNKKSTNFSFGFLHTNASEACYVGCSRASAPLFLVAPSTVRLHLSCRVMVVAFSLQIKAVEPYSILYHGYSIIKKMHHFFSNKIQPIQSVQRNFSKPQQYNNKNCKENFTIYDTIVHDREQVHQYTFREEHKPT